MDEEQPVCPSDGKVLLDGRMLKDKELEYKIAWLQEAQRLFKWAGFRENEYQEIANEYCGQGCCPFLPWLWVHTARGTFKLGWRKRVMELNWERTNIKQTAEELFPKEDVTKMGKLIHCWTYAKAVEYLAVLAQVK